MMKLRLGIALFLVTSVLVYGGYCSMLVLSLEVSPSVPPEDAPRHHRAADSKPSQEPVNHHGEEKVCCSDLVLALANKMQFEHQFTTPAIPRSFTSPDSIDGGKRVLIVPTFDVKRTVGSPRGYDPTSNPIHGPPSRT